MGNCSTRSHDKSTTQNINNEPKILKKILIVDDVISMATLMKKYFEAIHFEVKILCAGSGTECINICNEHNDVDLIFMDLFMEPQDGYTTAEYIFKHLSYEPIIIAMTGQVEKDSIARCKKIGMTDIYQKPVNYKELIIKLADIGLILK